MRMSPRKLFRLKLRSRVLRLGERTLIMGVLNVTPDSFSDGNRFISVKTAVEAALAIERAGADILDIGAESTRPGSAGISASEELARLLPVLEALRGRLKIPISVDTRKAGVAELAIRAGAEIVNDVSGLQHDPHLALAAVRYHVPLVLMHMRGTPQTMQTLPFAKDVLRDVLAGLRQSVSVARRAGVPKSQIVLDPGIGFGKSYAQNYELLSRLPASPNWAIRSLSELRARVFSALRSPAVASPLLLASESGARPRRSPPAFSTARTSSESMMSPKCFKWHACPMHCAPLLSAGALAQRARISCLRYNLAAIKSVSKGTLRMLNRPHYLASFLVCLAACPLFAQLPPVATDPLHPAQGIQGAAGCSATEVSSCAQAASKITPIVMGESPLEENLRKLTNDIGGRVSGSREMAEAVDWAVAALRAAGVDVHTEKFMLPIYWTEGATRLNLLGPVSFRVSLVAEGLSPATPPEGLEAALVDVGYGTPADFAAAGSSAKGAILLVHADIPSTFADLFDEYLRPPPIIDQAVKAGA